MITFMTDMFTFMTILVMTSLPDNDDCYVDNDDCYADRDFCYFDNDDYFSEGARMLC